MATVGAKAAAYARLKRDSNISGRLVFTNVIGRYRSRVIIHLIPQLCFSRRQNTAAPEHNPEYRPGKEEVSDVRDLAPRQIQAQNADKPPEDGTARDIENKGQP